MKKWNRKRPLAAAGVIAVCAVLFCMLTNRLAVSVLAGLLILAAVLFCLFRKTNTAAFFLITGGTVVLCALSFFFKEACVVEPTRALLDKTVTVTGTVYETPIKKDNTTLIPLENCVINGEQTKLKLSIYCKSYDPAEIGDIMYVEEAEIFAFAEDGVFYYHTLSEGSWLRAYTRLAVSTGKTDDSLIYKIRRFRVRTTQTLTGRLGETEGGIAAALLTGDRSVLTEEFTSDLRITGGSHLFAVSGMHLSIWTGVIFLILRKRSRIKLLPNIAAIAFTLVYIAVTGFSPSVIRAGIMLILTFAGKMTRLLSDGLNSLGIAALLLLAGNIYLAGNVSFLLSFSATWGIIVLTPYFTFTFTKAGKKPNLVQRSAGWTVNTVLVSLIALSFTVPVSSFFFTGVSLLSPVITLLCTLPVQATMISAFLALCYSTIPVLGPFCFSICSYSCKAIAFFVNRLSEWDFCVLPVNRTFLLIWYLLTGLLLLIIYYSLGRKSMHVLIALLISASLLLSAQIFQSINVSKTPVIYVHAAGNGTAVTLNIKGNAFCAQIGTGGNRTALDSIQAYYLMNGVTKPDVLIIPRVSDAENGNTAYFKYTAKAIYSASGNEEFYGTDRDICEADNFTLFMADTFTYDNIQDPLYAAGILETKDIKLVFSFWPGGDFTDADERLLSGDYLICRGGLPAGLHTENYENVLVLSDKTAAELGLPPGVETTADGGRIIIASAPEN